MVSHANMYYKEPHIQNVRRDTKLENNGQGFKTVYWICLLEISLNKAIQVTLGSYSQQKCNDKGSGEYGCCIGQNILTIV